MKDNQNYCIELEKASNINIAWEKYKNKSILITGATGLIGSFLIDVLMYKNKTSNLNVTVIANSLDINSINDRFKNYVGNKNFKTLVQNISNPLSLDYHVDYIIHAASNANPNLFNIDPVGTMLGNFCGLLNILDYANKFKVERVLYISSGEVYGQTSENIQTFNEEYNGYVDILNPRSCYPMSKRASETLAVSYHKQYGTDVVIARPCHIFGPTAKVTDNRVSSQFVRNALLGQNITLKSKGEAKRSYCYITDAVSGLLYILDKGEAAQAYNVANPNSIVTIKEMAQTIADLAGVELKFDIPIEQEKNNFNPMDLAILDASKLLSLGWTPIYDFKDAMANNIKILKDVKN